jgi:hypothetical protein
MDLVYTDHSPATLFGLHYAELTQSNNPIGSYPPLSPFSTEHKKSNPITLCSPFLSFDSHGNHLKIRPTRSEPPQSTMNSDRFNHPLPDCTINFN